MQDDSIIDIIPEEEKNLAVLVSCFKDKEAIAQEHLNELERLAKTAGFKVVHKQLYVLKKIDVSKYLTQGKLQQLFDIVGDLQAKTVIFDHEIAPSQQRNLEKFFKVSVIDRTELILDIFSQRALTPEARTQVELAKARYMFPRLKRLWGHFSRQRAKGGFLKGEGEKQLELDRRMLKDRITLLSRKLKKMIQVRELQRSSREKMSVPSFSIIGYTNAGKSSLFNILTRSEVLVEDKLFATLDPKTKKIIFPDKQEAIITDTVGLIRKLPHTLVAAFKSTIEATLHSDILIHVVDVSDPAVEEHLEITYRLLEELKINGPQIITVLNKIDLCENEQRIEKLQTVCSSSVLCSMKTGYGIDTLLTMMEHALSKDFCNMELALTLKDYRIFTELVKQGFVIDHGYDEDVLLVQVKIPVNLLHKYLPFEIKNN